MESVVLLKFNRGITELMEVVNCDAYVAVCDKQNLGSQPQSYRSQRGKYFEADGPIPDRRRVPDSIRGTGFRSHPSDLR